MILASRNLTLPANERKAKLRAFGTGSDRKRTGSPGDCSGHPRRMGNVDGATRTEFSQGIPQASAAVYPMAAADHGLGSAFRLWQARVQPAQAAAQGVRGCRQRGQRSLALRLERAGDQS